MFLGSGIPTIQPPHLPLKRIYVTYIRLYMAILCAPFGMVNWPPTGGWKGHFESPGTLGFVFSVFGKMTTIFPKWWVLGGRSPRRNQKDDVSQTSARWFKPPWPEIIPKRWAGHLTLWKGSLSHTKKVTLNHQVGVFFLWCPKCIIFLAFRLFFVGIDAPSQKVSCWEGSFSRYLGQKSLLYKSYPFRPPTVCCFLVFLCCRRVWTHCSNIQVTESWCESSGW